MRCVVLQPSYIPWRGYFHQIQKSDVFVFYDDVQYDRHGWRNRNRVKTRAGTKWLTIPVRSGGEDWREKSIAQMEISWERCWTKIHFETLRHSYSDAPYYGLYRPMLELWYASRPQYLADFTIQTTIDLAHELGLRRVQFLRSSALGGTGAKTGRLLTILKQLDATHYISGPLARNYLQVAELNGAGISVEWMDYDYPEYPQLFPPFDPQVSVLDLLMMEGPNAGRYIWDQH
jgi:hypothetical protein